MQSILQFHRLGDSVRYQIQRKGKGSIHLNTTLSSDSSESSSGASSPRSERPDLEKQSSNASLERTDTNIPAGYAAARGPCPLQCQDDFGTRNARLLPGVEIQDEKSGNGRSKVFVVGQDPNSTDTDPRKWSLKSRIWATVLIYLHGSVVGIASSIDSAALRHAREGFDKGELTEALTIGLFLIGFGFGGLFGIPLSERWGRNPAYMAAWFLFIVCMTASSLSPSVQCQLAFRFLAGFFGSGPLALGGACIGDLWSPQERTYTFPIFSNAALMGPILGPAIGGYVGAKTNQSWRRTEWTDIGAAGVVFILVVFTQRETYAPVLLHWKAKQLQRLTGDTRYTSSHTLSRASKLSRLRTTIIRPFTLTFTEPILLLNGLWMIMVWILMFILLRGYNYIFAATYHTSETNTGLCFLGLVTGLLLSSATVPLIYLCLRSHFHRPGVSNLRPESRLWYALISTPVIPISLLWMGYTARSDGSTSIWSPLAASVVLGYGMLGTFTSCCEYIGQCFGPNTGFALCWNTWARYIIAGITVVASPYIWRGLGVQHTMLVLACMCAVLVPVPYVFYCWGPRFRARSRMAVKP